MQCVVSVIGTVRMYHSQWDHKGKSTNPCSKRVIELLMTYIMLGFFYNKFIQGKQTYTQHTMITTDVIEVVSMQKFKVLVCDT